MSSNVDERITDEIEALEAILLDDVTIHCDGDRPYMVETVVHPSTGDDTDLQYVCVTLEVTLTPEYPDTSPSVKLRSPRGLDDSIVESIMKQIHLKLLECIGQSVVFELIELIRENLTNKNLPSGQCVICLYDFTMGDEFIKTPCYHHFHSYCLARHLEAGEKNYHEEFEKLPLWQKPTAKPYMPTCPVCREAISCDSSALRSAPPPLALRNARSFELTKELRELQKRMADLYQRQRVKGGIIDTEADNSKLLLLTTDEGAANKSDSSPDESPTEEVNSLPSEPSAPKQGDSHEGSASCSPQGGRGGYRGPYRGFNRNRGYNRRGKGRAVHGANSCAPATR